MAIKLKRYNKILGFDISENSITVIEIRLVKNGASIANGFQIYNPTFQDVNQTIELIKENLRAFNIKTRECVFGFSMQYFKFFPVPMPLSIPPEELDSIILQEGNIDLEKQVATWKQLENTYREDLDGIKRLDVLGISTEKNLIEFSKLISQKCGLKLLSVTPSFFGYGMFLIQEGNTRNLSGTLSISQLRSELVLWLGKDPIYEHLFLTHQLSDQIFQSINYIQSQLPGSKFTTLYASGQFLKEVNLTQIPYKIESITLPSTVTDGGKVLQRINPKEAIVATGLALAASNNFFYFIPNLLDSIKQKKETIKEVKAVFKDFAKAQTKIKIPFNFMGKFPDSILVRFVSVAVIIFLFSTLASSFIQYVMLPSVLTNQNALGNRLNLAQLQIAKLLNYEKTNKILVVKHDFFAGLIEKRIPWSKILKEIASLTPKSLWIDRLEIRNKSINIFGRALDVDSVANFSINLNHIAELVGKTKIIALRKFQEEGVDIVEFELSTKMIMDKKNNLDNSQNKELSLKKSSL